MVTGKGFSYVIFDEMTPQFRRLDSIWRRMGPLILRDNRDWYRGGRYRKPPVQAKHKPAKGCAMVRDRNGRLVERQLAPSIQQTSAWGMF